MRQGRATRSRSRRSRSSAPPNIRAKTARWRCTCTRRCGRRSRPSSRPALTSTSASRCRPSAILARIERTGVLIDAAPARAQSQRARRAHAGARARGLRDRRPAVQPRQPEADRRDPVRQARPAGRSSKTASGTPVDRRGGARRARRRLSRCRPACSSTAACRS